MTMNYIKNLKRVYIGLILILFSSLIATIWCFLRKKTESSTSANSIKQNQLIPGINKEYNKLSTSVITEEYKKDPASVATEKDKKQPFPTSANPSGPTKEDGLQKEEDSSFSLNNLEVGALLTNFSDKWSFFKNNRNTIVQDLESHWINDYPKEEQHLINKNFTKIANASQIKYLSIINKDIDKELSDYLSKFISLEVLSLECLNINDSSFMASLKLKKIALLCCEFDQKLLDLLSKSNNLTSASFRILQANITYFIDFSCLSKFPALKVLKLNSCNLIANHLKQICKCKNLDFLDLEGNYSLFYTEMTDQNRKEIDTLEEFRFKYSDNNKGVTSKILYRLKTIENLFGNLASGVTKLNLNDTMIYEEVVKEIYVKFT